MNQKRKKFIFVLAVAVIAVGIGIYFYTRPKEVTNYSPEFEENQEKKQSETKAAGIEDGIQIPGYTSITIASGTKDVSVELVNPEENDVYFEISFYLPDTDETIYTSKLISPGQHLYDITLERAMETGEYPLTVKYATYSADESLIPKNGAEVNCTLVVK